MTIDSAAASPARTPEQITEAFWQACHGGQRRVADYLLHRRTPTPAESFSSPGYASAVQWWHPRTQRQTGKEIRPRPPVARPAPEGTWPGAGATGWVLYCGSGS